MSEMNNSTGTDKRPEVTIKFGKGLMEEPFTSKKGTKLVEIKIPNADRNDSRPWESFVVPANFVHENKYGKGMWLKLPEDGATILSRNVLQGQDQNGKNIWGKETREISNKELKALVETYKTRDRKSVVSDLSQKKSEVMGQTQKPVGEKKRDDVPFR